MDHGKDKRHPIPAAPTLWALARDLPPAQYEALWLRYGRDLSVKEIARTMKRSQVGVKVLLYRARTALAQQWRETPEDVR